MIRKRFTDPESTLRELFGRIIFNICVSNTDDHARNHAAFHRPSPSSGSGSGSGDLTLTPAYDVCPQLRSGETAAQAMAIHPDGRRMSNLELCVDAAATYQLTEKEARKIIEWQVQTIRDQWSSAADAAQLSAADRARLWERQILNPAIFYIP